MNVSLCSTTLALAIWASALPSTVWAAAQLRCEVTYAGSTQVVETQAVSDPYTVPSVDISGRFWFKAVMVGQAARVDYIKLYAYLDTRTQPLLIQEAIFLPPFQASSTPTPLTGTQRLYAGPVGRELIYNCSLQGAQP
jgi:hypothetical protein